MLKQKVKPAIPIIAIVGPTASGKSDLAVTLALQYNGEVVSADSRQVYVGLTIGTGKITKKEMRGVPHHLLDVANPKKQFTVAEYKSLAEQAITDISSRGKLPILCGGTGFYIDAVLTGMALPEVPPNLPLRKELEKKTVKELFLLLQKLDTDRAKTIEAENPRRLIRAIEIAKALGRVPKLKAKSPYGVLWIGIRPEEERLRKNIHERLQKRVRQGMIREAKKLHKQGLSWKRMEELGLEYRFLARFLQKKITREEMLVQLESEINHYAKRQWRWFKRNKEIVWFERPTLKTKKLLREWQKKFPQNP